MMTQSSDCFESSSYSAFYEACTSCENKCKKKWVCGMSLFWGKNFEFIIYTVFTPKMRITIVATPIGIIVIHLTLPNIIAWR